MSSLNNFSCSINLLKRRYTHMFLSIHPHILTHVHIPIPHQLQLCNSINSPLCLCGFCTPSYTSFLTLSHMHCTCICTTQNFHSFTHALHLQLYNSINSPLCLCDFCPRAFHLSCLDLRAESAEQLRDGGWACPRCARIFNNDAFFAFFKY